MNHRLDSRIGKCLLNDLSVGSSHHIQVPGMLGMAGFFRQPETCAPECSGVLSGKFTAARIPFIEIR